MLDIKRVLASAPRKPEQTALEPLYTVWGERIAEGCESEPVHPHPQFERASFQSLDGWWDYRIVSCESAETAWRTAEPPTDFEGSIRVPFSPEAPLSSVNRQLMPNELLWYRRTFPTPSIGARDRLFLHFEAVDYACACLVNGTRVGNHVGGYLPFSFDITDALADGANEIALCVYDPSDEGVQLRGKQKLDRGGIWYTAQSGIWQTVWLEAVPEAHIESIEIDAQADAGVLELVVTVHDDESAANAGSTALTVRLFDGDAEVLASVSDAPAETAHADTGSGASEAGCASHALCTHRLVLDVARPHLWSPEDPHLYRLELSFGDDRVKSYCAFRTVSMEPDEHGIVRLCVNHEPRFLRGVLDQGYWPDGLLTAPSDEALAFDIETCKKLGFTMLRKHIKIESDRWYYHCDRLGMLVWQDMVSGGSPLSAWHSSYKPTFFRRSWTLCADDTPKRHRAYSAGSDAYRAEWTDTCAGTVAYLKNHPSIVTWVLFNEAWGQFDARTATEAVRALDPTRPIDAVSGWYDQACGDFSSVHNYFRPLEVYADQAQPRRAFVISEFGGLSYHVPDHSSLSSSYGYGSFTDLTAFRAAVGKALADADSLESEGLAGFVYTQLSDVEEETNGILTYDRRINKLDGDPIGEDPAIAACGAVSASSQEGERR